MPHCYFNLLIYVDVNTDVSPRTSVSLFINGWRHFYHLNVIRELCELELSKVLKGNKSEINPCFK